MPATAKFLQAVVAGLPQGAVVLPGLDTDLDDDAWQTIGGVRDAQGQVHHAARVEPSAIRDAGACWTDSASSAATSKSWAAPAPHGRDVLVSETMRPSNATAQWHRRLAEPEIAEKISAA